MPESVLHYVALLKKLEKDYRVKQFFNTALSRIQQYLFHRLKVEPTSKVEVQYDDSKLVELTKVEDEDEVSPPPFSYVYVQTSSGKIIPEDPVVMIKSRYKDVTDPQQSVETLFNSEQEKNILETFLTITGKGSRYFYLCSRSLCEYHFRLLVCKNGEAWIGSVPWKREEEEQHY